MFPDPIVVKAGDTNTNFVRIGLSANEGRFHAEGSGPPVFNRDVVIKQNQTKTRFRREFRIVDSKDFTDPLSGLTIPVGASVYLVVDEPKVGYSDGDLNDMVNGLIEFFDDALESNMFKLLSGEY